MQWAVNTKSHNRSKCREWVSGKPSGTNGTPVRQPLCQGSGNIAEVKGERLEETEEHSYKYVPSINGGGAQDPQRPPKDTSRRGDMGEGPGRIEEWG